MVLRGLFQKLRHGLAKTRNVFSGVAQLFGLRGKVDQAFLDQLERQLYLADVGTTATAQIVISIRGSLVKSISSLLTIGSGGSIGREGAMGCTAKSPASSKSDCPVSLYLYCPNIDELYQKAKSEGASNV